MAAAGCSGEAADRAVLVAAASDLALAAPALTTAFEKAHSRRVEIVIGSSGLLSRQIAEGAPYDAFLSADESFVVRVVEAGACDGRTRRAYARGRVVVWAAAGAPAPRTLADLVDGRFARIAIANPEHAPYGRAARQALERAGLWSRLERRIVRGENVRATLELARTGNADVAFVAASQASAAGGGTTVPVREDLYDPLVQTAVACTQGRAPAAGRAFVDLVASARGAAILARFALAPASGAAP